MPGLNKKGPQNMGPMTGRRLGACSIDTAETDDKQAFGRRQGNSRRRAGGEGRCGGRGMGRGLSTSAGSGRGRGMRGQFR